MWPQYGAGRPKAPRWDRGPAGCAAADRVHLPYPLRLLIESRQESPLFDGP